MSDARVILIAVGSADAAAWLDRFRAEAPRRNVRPWPVGSGDSADIGYACVWKAPPGALTPFRNLRAIFNLGAGVDALLRDPDLPRVPIVRAVHPDLSMRMTEYVVLHVLMHHRRQRLYDAQQRARVWQGHDQPAASEVTVGIMGLGAIGSEAADVLRRIGFQIAGWSRSPKLIPGIQVFSGADGLEAFLARTEILVCLLPHTPQTENILDLPLFRKLKRDGALGGAYLINAGRGGLQVDADILRALEEGTLAGVTLDVFPREPLQEDSPFWSHPSVTITPHNAGDLAPRALVRSVIEQIERFERGQALQHTVDIARGY
jgi:glyoxylate/hydroxypyruvate reductase A